MYYINTLKRELVDTNAYKLQPSLSERVIVDGHGCHTALHFGVKAKENQDKVPTLYWLPKLHKKPYKARFIANSSSCTTTELSKLLTSCLTAVKKHVIKYCEKVYERSGKNLFWSIKNSGEILDKLKARDSVILLPAHPASFAHNFVSGMQSFYFSESKDAIVLQTCH